MWFEDIVIGSKRALGSHTFTQDEIMDFGRKYDPQIFHVDPVAAAASPVGGIIASGWHTVAVWMKLAIESRKAEARAGSPLERTGVSPGFENLRWLKPVRPGTTLIYSAEVVEKVDLKSRPELGMVKSRNEARDGAGTLYMSFTGKGFVAKRPKVD